METRRTLLRMATAVSAAIAPGAGRAFAQQGGSMQTAATVAQAPQNFRRKMIGYMLAHEQFPVPELVRIGTLASQSGFHLLATSDHLQPWQANEGHCGEAWVTLGALGQRTQPAWIGTTVTCPTLRYNPAVVAGTFASLSRLYPGRVFLGVGSGEALNEDAATGVWPKWPERWERLIKPSASFARCGRDSRSRIAENITRSTAGCTIRRRSRSPC
jgi:alkanesulfonate monooxygenase SsuD/methylene tetrahydromethanopterin reductase-like flavin-dependent oxidoreductase (luciferase family)